MRVVRACIHRRIRPATDRSLPAPKGTPLTFHFIRVRRVTFALFGDLFGVARTYRAANYRLANTRRIKLRSIARSAQEASEHSPTECLSDNQA